MRTKEIERAKEVLRKAGYIMIFWHKYDILQVATDNDIELTDEQIQAVIEKMENSDSNCISYEAIETIINTVTNENT